MRTCSTTARAWVAIVSAQLLERVQALPDGRLRYLRDVVVVGGTSIASSDTCRFRLHDFSELLDRSVPELAAEPTSRDAR